MLLACSTGRSTIPTSGGCRAARAPNMQAFSFGQINVPGQRSMLHCSPKGIRYGANCLSDYVFVDEHNRHKRLKGEAFVVVGHVFILLF